MNIAITGTIGSGKSTVAQLLRDLGYPVFDADAHVRKLYEPDGALYPFLVQTFPETLRAGHVDHALLADIIFSDPKRKVMLEQAVHANVRQAMHQMMNNPFHSLQFFEVPLLFETRIHHDFDQVVLVDARPELRLDRLQRRGVSRAEAARRMQAQLPDETKRQLADIILENNGDPEVLKAKVKQLAHDLEVMQDARE